jgi:uncharacterized protein YgiM (DUF1202 family)
VLETVKERKTMRLASLLLVCVLLCGMLATFASAAGALRATYVLNVTTSAANVRREASTDAEVIGNLVRGDEFKTSSNPYATWYYGLPGPETEYYKVFGFTFGYVNRINFL